MLILPAFILAIGLFSGWTGSRALRVQRPVLGSLMLTFALTFVSVSVFLFWALLKVSNLQTLGP